MNGPGKLVGWCGVGWVGDFYNLTTIKHDPILICMNKHAKWVRIFRKYAIDSFGILW